MLSNLQFILFFVCFFVKNFKKIYIYYFAMGNIVVYYITIILNIPKMLVDCIKFKVVKE